MRFSTIILIVFISLLPIIDSAKEKWVRRCKRSIDNDGWSSGTSHLKNATDMNGCAKNVWVSMDRASKCPELNGAKTDVLLAEAPVQPRLYGRRGIYSAHCEFMIIVVKHKGCVLLDTDSIEFKCRDNIIYYNGREVTSFVCAQSVY